MSTLPKGALEHAEVLVLRALAEPGTRWHHVADLVTRTELTEGSVRRRLRKLYNRGFATGPPLQPFKKWSITTTGAQALAQAEVAADVRLEEAR